MSFFSQIKEKMNQNEKEKMKEKYYGKKDEDINSCEYYKKRIKSIITDIRDDKDPPVSLMRNIACAKDCKGGDNTPFVKLTEKIFDLAGLDLMTENLYASGYTTNRLQKIIKKNASDILEEF
jgi:hypothetical protein